MKYDVIIIGSGLGGLECGQVLSKRGMKVLILERQAQLGGSMQSYKRKGEFLDTGMHYAGGLGFGHCLYAPLKNMGLLDLPWVHLDPTGFDRVTIGDRDFRYAEGHKAFTETLLQDFPDEAEGLRKYCEVMSAVGDHIHDSVKPRDEVDFFATSLFGTGAYNFLQENFKSNLLRNVLSGSSLKMELAKDTLPLYNFAQANNSFIQSSWRLAGDGNLLVNKLVSDIRSFGGEVIANAGVEELIEKDGKLVAARCANGETYEADLFISNVHPAVTMDLIKESQHIRKVYRNRLHRMENSYGMFTVSLVIKPGALKYFNWNQYIYKEPNVWTYFNEDKPVQGILISCRAPEVKEIGFTEGNTLQDRDTHVIDILTPLPWDKIKQWEDTTVGHRGDDYLEFKERMADECIDLAERFIPDLRSKIEARFTSTPLTFRDYNMSPNGSAYGIRKDYHNPMMTLLSAKTPVPNLLLTGQNLTLHGLLGVTMTTLFTVAEVLGKEEAYNLTIAD